MDPFRLNYLVSGDGEIRGVAPTRGAGDGSGSARREQCLRAPDGWRRSAQMARGGTGSHAVRRIRTRWRGGAESVTGLGDPRMGIGRFAHQGHNWVFGAVCNGCPDVIMPAMTWVIAHGGIRFRRSSVPTSPGCVGGRVLHRADWNFATRPRSASPSGFSGRNLRAARECSGLGTRGDLHPAAIGSACGIGLRDRLDVVPSAHEHAVEETLATWAAGIPPLLSGSTAAGVEPRSVSPGCRRSRSVRAAADLHPFARVHRCADPRRAQWRTLAGRAVPGLADTCLVPGPAAAHLGVPRSLGWGFEFAPLNPAAEVVADAG